MFTTYGLATFYRLNQNLPKMLVHITVLLSAACSARAQRTTLALETTVASIFPSSTPNPSPVSIPTPSLRPVAGPHPSPSAPVRPVPSASPSKTSCTCPTSAPPPSSPAPPVPTLPNPPVNGGPNQGSKTYCGALENLMCSNKQKKICAGELADDLRAYHGRYGIRYGEALVDGAGEFIGSCLSIPFNIIDPEDGPFDDVSLKKCYDGLSQTNKCLLAIRALIDAQEKVYDSITASNNKIRTEWGNRCAGRAHCRNAAGAIIFCPNFTQTYGFNCPSGASIRAKPQCNWPNANMPKPAICTK